MNKTNQRWVSVGVTMKPKADTHLTGTLGKHKEVLASMYLKPNHARMVTFLFGESDSWAERTKTAKFQWLKPRI